MNLVLISVLFAVLVVLSLPTLWQVAKTLRELAAWSEQCPGGDEKSGVVS